MIVLYSCGQEENSELGEKVKNNRFRWHNCDWLEKVTGETFYDEENESDDDYYLDHYLLHSAAELDNPDYFYHGPDSNTTMPMEGGGNLDRAGYPLSTEQYYGSVGQIEGTFVQPSYNELTPYPPQNSPFPSSDYETELIMHTAGNGVRESVNPQFFMKAENNPLASPGMLFEREPDEDIDSVFHPSISARQLMPAMEDPLAMYSASFKDSMDVKQNHESFTTSMDYPTGFTVMDRQRDRQGSHQTSVDGF